MKIAIAGPGRSGTSLLVQLFYAWGFSAPNQPLYLPANAGLEARIGSGSPYEVHKDPWAFEYTHNLDPGSLSSYEAFIIPIRSPKAAVTSRLVQERFHRATRLIEDQWSWDSWGSVPGGAVSPTTASAVEATLAIGLWNLLEVLTAQGQRVILLNFPRFGQDFDYLWSMVGDLVRSRCSQAEAYQAWMATVDEDLITRGAKSEADEGVAELHGLIEMLRRDNREIKEEMERLAVERDEARMTSKLLLTSRTWRATGWYRRLRRRPTQGS